MSPITAANISDILYQAASRHIALCADNDRMNSSNDKN